MWKTAKHKGADVQAECSAIDECSSIYIEHEHYDFDCSVNGHAE